MNPHTPPLFEGCGTALVTPFRGGALDKDAFRSLVRRQVAAGVDALIVAGTTGESPTLTDGEKEWLFTAAVREARAATAAVKVIAGTGSNSTAHACRLSRMAEACGCDGLLVVTPYYNKTSEAGLAAHYGKVAEATSLPLLLYHVPSRTGCTMTPGVCRILAEHPRVVGLKDATGDMAYTARVAALCGDRLPIYAGNDDLTVPIHALGGRGVISVVSNLCPERVSRLCRLCREGRYAEATAEQLALLPLCEALFREVNPIPVKAAMALLGLCEGEVRLPLVPADEKVRRQVAEAMGRVGMEGGGA